MVMNTSSAVRAERLPTRLLMVGLFGLAIQAGLEGRANAGGCETQTCGSNSPELTGTRMLEELSLTGETVLGMFHSQNDGVIRWIRLDPNSFKAPGCNRRIRMVLGVRDGALVGVDQRGNPVCTGKSMVGASFDIESWSHPRGLFGFLHRHAARRTIRIAAVGQVSTWLRDKPAPLPTHLLRFSDDGTSVCAAPRPWMDPWQLAGLRAGATVENPPGVRGARWHGNSEFALVLQGETYNDAGDVQHTGKNWITLACAGSAAAKMRLLGYDPMDSRTTAGQRQATLKMLTARYNGKEKSYTEQGVRLMWKSRQDGAGVERNGASSGATPLYFGGPLLGVRGQGLAGRRQVEDTVGPIEAVWGSGGATCLSHLRLWNAVNIPFGAAILEKFEEPFALVTTRCDEKRSPEEFDLPDGAEWVTFTLDHVSHISIGAYGRELAPPRSRRARASR